MFKHWREGLPLVCEPCASRYPAGMWLRLSFSDGSTSWPHGWALLRMQLHWHGKRGLTRLRLVESDGAERLITLPVSRRGRLLELVHLDSGVREVWLQPMNGKGWCALEQQPSLRPQQGLEAFTRRLQRVLPMLWRQPRTLRHRVGLRTYLVLRDLNTAYARAGELRDYVPDTDYRRWAFLHNHLTEDGRRCIATHIASWREPPQFIVEIDNEGGGNVSVTRASLEAQLYQGFTVKEPNGELTQDRKEWVLYLPAGVRLMEHALYWLAYEAQTYPDARAIYSDHDLILDDFTLHQPHFKPDCSLALLACTPYMGPVVALRADVLAKAPERDVYAAMLLLAQQPNSVRHVPAVLCHVPQGLDWRQPKSERAALEAVFPAAMVEEGLCGHWRLRHPLPMELPRVSVVVPTRDNLAVLYACIESVLSRSTYPNLELLVVDNLSSDTATLEYLATLPAHSDVRVLRYVQPFNFSAINNWAVSQATGELICLLNNDTEVITPGWLEEMVAQLLVPGVGAVGAKLYYSDGRVQHAGDAVGPGGCADHFFNGLAHDDPGYMDRSMLVQDLSAVTAACLLTYRSLYQQLGGLDAINLPVAFNDVDYCLRVRELGRRVVWTPYAELYHHESVSRGKDESPEKRARASRELFYMRRHWKKVLRNDPFYNPNLSYERPDFSYARQPRLVPPWRDGVWKRWR